MWLPFCNSASVLGERRCGAAEARHKVPSFPACASYGTPQPDAPERALQFGHGKWRGPSTNNRQWFSADATRLLFQGTGGGEAGCRWTSPATTARINKLLKELVHVLGVDGKAVAWSHSYGLIEWLDFSGRYHLDWAHSANIRRVPTEEWKGSSGL